MGICSSASFPTKNKTLEIMVKAYTVADIKNYWSSPILLKSFTLIQVTVTPLSVILKTFLITTSHLGWNLLFWYFLIHGKLRVNKSVTSLKWGFNTGPCLWFLVWFLIEQFYSTSCEYKESPFLTYFIDHYLVCFI